MIKGSSRKNPYDEKENQHVTAACNNVKSRQGIHSNKRINVSEKSEEELGTCTLMDASEVNRTMKKIRNVIRQEGLITDEDIGEIKKNVLFLTESGNERSMYTHQLDKCDTGLLCEAVIHDRLEVVVMLVEMGMNVDASSDENESHNLPLHVACVLGKVDSAAFLLDNGAVVDTKCSLEIFINEQWIKTDLTGTFSHALLYDRLNILQLLFKHANLIPNFLLHEACKAGASDCVRFLCGHLPEQLTVQDYSGRTPLTHAFWKDPKLADILVQSNTDLLKSECSPSMLFNMMMAVCFIHPNLMGAYDRVGAVRFLVKHGGTSLVNRSDSDGTTPLHNLCSMCGNRASMRGNGGYQSYKSPEEFDEMFLSCINIILESGADVEKKNWEGHTPLVTLLKKLPGQNIDTEFYSEEKIKAKYSCVSRALKVLIRYGAKVNDNEALYCLIEEVVKLKDCHLLLVHDKLEIMLEDLLNETGNPNVRDRNGWPVLLRFMEAYLIRTPCLQPDMRPPWWHTLEAPRNEQHGLNQTLYLLELQPMY